MTIKTTKKTPTKKQKLAKSLRNKKYYAKRKQEKDILNGVEPTPKTNSIKRETCMILITSHKKNIEKLYQYNIVSKVYKKFNEIIKENEEKIEFPVKYISNKNISRGTIESDYEILLVKIKKDGDTITQLRNEYGQMVDHIIVDDDKWIIIDKHIYYKEETFWVYGFNPKTQRKDFNFILNQMILLNVNNKNYFRRVLVFKNKLIIQYDNDIDMVICKNKEDAIRLYNELEIRIKKEKIRNIFFNGMVSKSNRDWMIETIMNKTGWGKQKVVREKTVT